MGFFDKLFGKSDTKNSDQNNLNADSLYNDELISTLLKDHKNLLNEFNKISKLAKSKKEKALKQYLKAFKVNLEIHNYSEKIQLYTYLKNYYKDKNEEKFIEEMAQSAEKIYSDVFKFLKKYEQIDFNDQYFELFKNELNAIGKILVSRIEIEESELYPLYKK